MQFSALDCQSYAGGFALGVVQAGFTLVGKREQAGGFGVPAMEANRHLLGTGWEAQDGPAASWTPVNVDLVFGNPPCSGFSNRSSMILGKLKDGTKGRLEFAGIDSAANSCMWDLVGLAAKCDPKIVIFESVQGAYRKGRSLMQALRADLEKKTGQEWTLYHVLHNVSDLGGAQTRLRYFWVASRIPFGVLPVHNEPVTVRDRIGDLEQAAFGSVEGHIIEDSAQERRIHELASKADWKPDETSGEVFARVDQELTHWDGPFVTDKGTTQFAPRRLNYSKPSRVLTGDAPWKVVHPSQPRTLSHREIARLSGFPDSWVTAPYGVKRKNSYWWGKGITVEAGRWIATAAHDALAGDPQPYKGDLIGEREYLINAQDLDYLTNDSPLFELED